MGLASIPRFRVQEHIKDNTISVGYCLQKIICCPKKFQKNDSNDRWQQLHDKVFDGLPRFFDSQEDWYFWAITLVFTETKLEWDDTYFVSANNLQCSHSNYYMWSIRHLKTNHALCLHLTLFPFLPWCTNILTFDQPLYWNAAEIIIDASQSSHLTGVIVILWCICCMTRQSCPGGFIGHIVVEKFL